MNESRRNKSQKSVYLGLGSNIDPADNITRAVNKLKQEFSIINVSGIWESAPVGSLGPVFLNGVVAIKTQASYGELKNNLRKIEKALGRIRSVDKNAPRTIDIDILIFEDEIQDAQIWTLPYLAIPIAEVFPTLINPITGETIKRISDRLKEIYSITARNDIILAD